MPPRSAPAAVALLLSASLPTCTLKRGRLADLPHAAALWLGM